MTLVDAGPHVTLIHEDDDFHELANRILSLDQNDVADMKELMGKYRDLPMDFADAALVRVAEREKINRVFTLDRRDFQIYRPSRLGRFAILPA